MMDNTLETWSWIAAIAVVPLTIINAILDALAPLCITHIDMPATPERVWHAILSAGDS